MRLFLLIALIGFLISCNKSRVPKGVLPPDKMEKVLWDMIQADRYAIQYLARDSAKIDVKAETFKLYEEIFRIHNTNREEFRKSFNYYLERPQLNEAIYDSMGTKATRLREEMYKSMK
jgi:hypothetical protein